MKNNRPSSPALGPLPARSAGAAQRLAPARAEVLAALESQAEPTTLAALATSTGLHPNTLRHHLETLEADGLVERHRAPAAGRGRPAWLYLATDSTGTAPEYAALASSLARAIHRSSARPREDAAAAGEEWGRDLVRARGAVAAGPDHEARARRSVVTMLDDIGFAPESDTAATDVRLTRCPLLEAAHEHPEIVCSVHLGLVRGALEEHGAPTDEVALLPFAEPGACRLSMQHGAPR